MKLKLSEKMDVLKQSGPVFWWFSLCMIIVMAVICLAVFFSAVKGAEEVLVPSIVGKDFTEACIEMQAKELYPKVVLRYSDNPEDKGKVLEQSPKAGAIVKAGKRINVTVSRGSSIDKVEDFTGMTVEDVKTRLKTMFASSSRQLIVLGTPLYEHNSAPAGTVLHQEPAADTQISEPVTLVLVVSSGPENKKVSVPALVGRTLSDIYAQMQSSSLIYDFTAAETTIEGNAVQVISQTPEQGTSVSEYSRVNAVIAYPETKGINPPVNGLFTYQLLEYSYPMDMQLEAVPVKGNTYTIVSFSHPGGLLTIPYSVPKDTALVLSVHGKEITRIIVR